MKIFRNILITVSVMIACFIAIKLLVGAAAGLSSSKNVLGIEEAGVSFEELTIPSDARVVALGDATCGNAEFQAAKLDMLKKMIAAGNCRSIVFDIPVGEGALINAAIHGNGSHLTELMDELECPYYDTQQIIDLLAWAREYNKGRSYNNSVLFYGMEFGDTGSALEYLIEFAGVHPEAIKDGDIEKITALAGEGTDISSEKEYFKGLYDELSESPNVDYMIAAMTVDSILQSIDATTLETDPAKLTQYRNLSMAGNVQSISAIEEKRGYSQILITAHNDLVMKEATALGGDLQELFKDKYFCIGTDFYNTVVNLHTAGTYGEDYVRKDHEFCSLDILAYQASLFEGGRYVLVFGDVTESESRIYTLIHEDNYTGNLSDDYSLSMDLHSAYRTTVTVADRYDAMLYYYETTPIRILR